MVLCVDCMNEVGGINPFMVSELFRNFSVSDKHPKPVPTIIASGFSIPDCEIHLKIGGDYGGGSFKMSFQITNVVNPNEPKNTIVFSIMKAKDYKCNICLCLERFRLQIKQFEKVTWSNKKFRIMIFC